MFKNRLDFESAALDALDTTSFPTKQLLKILFCEEPPVSLLDWFKDIEDVEDQSENSKFTTIGTGSYSIIKANTQIKESPVTKWFLIDGKTNEYCFKEFVHELCNYLVLKTIVYKSGDRNLQMAFITFKNLVHHGGFFGIVMERLYEETVEFLFDDVVEILCKLNFLQVQGIYLIHGDMKESNIMITNSRELKIIDFGITIYKIEFEEGGVLENFCNLAPTRSIKELLHVDLALLSLSMGKNFEEFYVEAYENLTNFHDVEPFDFGKHLMFYTE